MIFKYRGMGKPRISRACASEMNHFLRTLALYHEGYNLSSNNFDKIPKARKNREYGKYAGFSYPARKKTTLTKKQRRQFVDTVFVWRSLQSAHTVRRYLTIRLTSLLGTAMTFITFAPARATAFWTHSSAWVKAASSSRLRSAGAWMVPLVLPLIWMAMVSS